MTDVNPVHETRTKALAALRANEENLKRIEEYATPDRRIVVFGVYPTGVGHAGVITAYLTALERDVVSLTYTRGDRFNKKDVKNHRILVVKDSVMENGIKQIGDKAVEAIQQKYLGPEDFRLVIVNPFELLDIYQICPEFAEKPRNNPRPIAITTGRKRSRVA